MNPIKCHFTIKDLENLCGIKAHTIRIWEKRYHLLHPQRTDTNIRRYSTANLQKLLNVVFLYKNGYKISKIAKLSEEHIPRLVKEIASEPLLKTHYINHFKIAMLHFDAGFFNETCHIASAQMSFREVFRELFVPLLNELGILWQINAISPSHEHFITHLIKQKISFHTEKLHPIKPLHNHRTYILYLPENEIHEIGLLYLNYELTAAGYRTLYLGQAMPLQSLKNLLSIHPPPVFVSYFTVAPASHTIHTYIEHFNKEMNGERIHELWMVGKQTRYIKNAPSYIKPFTSIEQLINTVHST